MDHIPERWQVVIWPCAVVDSEGTICTLQFIGKEATQNRAHLIATSPDLLALCRDLYTEVGKGGDLDWHLRERGYAERLRLLIEKADGKE